MHRSTEWAAPKPAATWSIPLLTLCVLWTLLPQGEAQAHGVAPPSLKGVAVPSVPGLLDGTSPIVTDQAAAVRLGKALFWDSAVGSDGVACASCHFHAGADLRTKNQLTTGTFHTDAATANTFEPLASGKPGGPNYTLKSGDFPFYRLANPDDKASAVVYSTDDVVSSMGVFKANYLGQPQGDAHDTCQSEADAVFHQGALNARRVEPRNTPTVINAAFNFRNFWDGRANNVFNGVSVFGPRDPEAAIWVVEDGKAERQPVRLANSSLASQAMAPAVSDTEMSCAGRTLPEVARKLLDRRPLESQNVHPRDSVLGAARHRSGKGLDTTYAALVKQAFAPRYWSGSGDFGASSHGGAPYSQMEANFSFFFGLALQLYQSTLISDDAPFDAPRDASGVPQGFTEQQAHGLQVFLESHCQTCHRGSTLSAASHPDTFSAPDPSGLPLVNRKTLKGAFVGSGVAFALMDEGYANTSVVPVEYDPGVGGTDPYGNPLSFTMQYLNALMGQPNAMVDPVTVRACAFDVPFLNGFTTSELVNDPFGTEGCGDRKPYAKAPSSAVVQAEIVLPNQGRALAAVHGAFKIPSLRNVELTGPYMHNGGMKSLEEVVDFYSRGGNLDNPEHFATLVFEQGLTAQDKADLIAFLKTLTDERVRWERAPFDHPQLMVPKGHTAQAAADGLKAEERYLTVPAVGKEGRSAKQGPLQSFASILKP
jgi:cytochrome c peroxidase